MSEQQGEDNNIRSKTGKSLSELTLEAATQGLITFEDLKISRETLHRQRDTAIRHHRPQLGANFDRAGELVDVPDAVILDMYNRLRPYRSTKEELTQLAVLLCDAYHAPQCAALVLEAADVYAQRGILR